MADHPDHQDRPLPFENVVTVFPANISAYRSTAVHVDNSGGGAAATVRVTWHMQDAATVSTWEEKTVAAGAATTLFFVNQGDTLESVSVSGGGGGTTHAVSESNQLPLPASGGGIKFDTYPQAGQWLYLETDGPASSPSGFGVEVFDDSGNGIDLSASSGGPILLKTVGGGTITISSNGDMVLVPAAGSHIRMQNLPAVNPGGVDRLWRDVGGFLMIT